MNNRPSDCFGARGGPGRQIAYFYPVQLTQLVCVKMYVYVRACLLPFLAFDSAVCMSVQPCVHVPSCARTSI